MKALWWSCVLGLLMSAYGATANDITAVQTPSNTSEVNLKSSFTIICSITTLQAKGVSFFRHFASQEVLYLSLSRGHIKKNTTKDKFNGRIRFETKPHRESLDLIITLSQLQVKDTDLYYCNWVYYNKRIVKVSTNGSIVIVKEHSPDKDPRKSCPDDTLDLLTISLSAVSIPLVLCLLVLSAFVMWKRFSRKFTPHCSVVGPPPRRPPPRRSLPSRPLPARPPAQYQTYSYLSTSVTSTLSHEYLH